MTRSRRKRSHHHRKPPRIRRIGPPGTPPATILVGGDATETSITVIRFSESSFTEESCGDRPSLADKIAEDCVTWIQVKGYSDVETLRHVGDEFGLHGLAMEDAVNSHQRAKMEAYDDHLFVVLHMVMQDKDTSNAHVQSDQLSLFLGPGFVLTLQQGEQDCLETVRERLRSDRSRIRSRGADFLAYSIVDAVVDSYFPAVDHYAERLEDLDAQIADGNASDLIDEIHNIRSDLMLLRRIIQPLRDSLISLMPDPHHLISNDTQFYFRDCFDHTIQLIELLDTYRETCSSLRDYYMSAMNQRMNEIMKVLTIVATIFIPISFITSLYGMNFDDNVPGNMPELKFPYAYPMVLGLMCVIALGQVWFMWRRGWLRR